MQNKNSHIQKKMSLQSLSYKVVGLQVCKFIKKRLPHRCFPVKFAKCLRTPILKNICERPRLHILFFAAQFWYVNWRQIKIYFFRYILSNNNAFFFVFAMAFCVVFEFTCAVRGFHVYRKFWIHEKGNYWTVSTRLAMYSILLP